MDQQDDSNKKIDWRDLPNLVSVTAPGALAVGSLLYLSGYIYNSAKFSPFGINNITPPPSFQVIMATGFAPLFLGTIFVSILGVLLWILNRYTIEIEKRFKKKAGDRKDKSLSMFLTINNFNRISLYIMASISLLSYSYYSGAYFGGLEADQIIETVKNRCKNNCATIITKKTKHRGVIISQSTNITAIFTEGGTFILKNDQIIKIYPQKANKSKILLKYQMY